MSARRALITGITGQDGSYLAELLVAKGYEVFGMVRDVQRVDGANIEHVRSELRLVAGDLLDADSLRAAVASSRPDELYHLAAPTFVPESWRQPAYVLEAISVATAVVLEAAAALDDAPRVFVTTSAEIFGDSGQSPQNEDSPMRPVTPYGVAKLAAHRLVGALRSRGLHVVSGITYNHESPRRPAHFLPRKVTCGAAAIALGKQEKLTLGDLDAIRDWSDARDIVRGAWMALQRDDADDYVFASGVGRSVRQLVDAAFAAAGVDPEGRIEVDPAFVRPPEKTPLVGDPARARKALGWEPEFSFETTIGEMVAADLAET